MNLRELSEWERESEASGGQASGEPCRVCRGRGYDRRNPDEPCDHCWGEGEEPAVK